MTRAVRALPRPATALLALVFLLAALAACGPSGQLPTTFGPCAHGTVKLIKHVWRCVP